MANNVKKINGIAIADVKKLNTIAAADIKELNGEEFSVSVDPSILVSYRQVEASGSGIACDTANVSAVYDTDNNYVVIGTREAGGGGRCVVGAYNSGNNDIDFGAEQSIATSGSVSGLSMDYDQYNNRLWAAWIGGSGNQIFARVGTINGPVIGDSASPLTISWGTTLTIREGSGTYPGKYNQGLLGQGLAVDQTDGACLVAWNPADKAISGGAGGSDNHPHGVILEIADVSTNNDLSAAPAPSQLVTGSSAQNYPMIVVAYDPDNAEWVGITDPANDIRALRITNNSGTPTEANETTLANNSGHSLQGQDHGATAGITGRYGGDHFAYDTGNNVFHVASCHASASEIFAFTNSGSGITFNEGGQAVATGEVLSQDGKAGGISYHESRQRIVVHGTDDSSQEFEVFTYDGSSYTSINSGSLVEIVNDNDGFYYGSSCRGSNMDSFLSNGHLLTGVDYDEREPYYCIIDSGG